MKEELTLQIKMIRIFFFQEKENDRGQFIEIHNPQLHFFTLK